MWILYIVECADRSLYTGITRDIKRRIHEHNTSTKLAAKYTRARRPVKLIYTETCATRSLAAKRESEIKNLTRNQKEKLAGVA